MSCFDILKKRVGPGRGLNASKDITSKKIQTDTLPDFPVAGYTSLLVLASLIRNLILKRMDFRCSTTSTHTKIYCMKLFVTALLILAYTMTTAQAPGTFKYQGIARDQAGIPYSDTTIRLRISIHQGSAGGLIVYRETQQPVTNEYGLFNVDVGRGTVVSGDFSQIPWSGFSFFQETELDTTVLGQYLNMGTFQYLSVPYSLSTDSAKNAVHSFLADSANRAQHSLNSDHSIYTDSSIYSNFSNLSGTSQSAITGIAPFEVVNVTNGNTLSNVAIIAKGNSDSAPAMFVQNLAAGDVFNAVAANGNYFLVGSDGIETNGSSLLSGPVTVSNSFSVNGNTLLNGSANIQGNAGLNGSVTNVTGQLVVGGPLNLSGNMTVGGVVTGGFNINGPLNVTGQTVVSGDLSVLGNLSKASGSFKIDHPLDPFNKILYHSFVESPDMKNIYDGVVTTDANGEAEVELPDYFQALNKDYRYQLTPIGQFAQAIISQEIENNKFHIKSDKPGVKISWQVTGIRIDAYAEKHRIVPEVEKSSAEKGKLLYPENW